MRSKAIANDRKSNEIYRNRCAPRILGTVDVFLEKLFMFLAICLGVHMIAAKFYIFFHTILLHQSHFSSTFIHFHIEHTYVSKYFAIKKTMAFWTDIVSKFLGWNASFEFFEWSNFNKQVDFDIQSKINCTKTLSEQWKDLQNLASNKKRAHVQHYHSKIGIVRTTN